MGKLSKALGVGSKGSLRIELDRGSYEAGDVVNGTVYLSVSDEIKSKDDLVLEVNGKEHVKYNEAYGQVIIPHKQKRTLMKDQVMLCQGREAFAPGEYVLPFNYQLRSTPGSFLVGHRHDQEICDIDATAKYELRLRLPVKGAFNADLKTQRELIVKAAQTQTAYAIQPRTDVTAQDAKLLGMIRKGNCEISASLERDVFVAGDLLQLRASIVNGSSMDVKSVSVRLVEELVILVNDDHRDVKAQTCLAEKIFPGVQAGATKIDQVYSLELVGRSDRYAVLPSVTSSLISTSHHVEVRCKFRMSPNVHIEIPVTILAQHATEVAAASPLEVAPEYKTKEL